MNRSLFAWSIYAVCLLATTSAVGWLTMSAWQADRARQEALLDSEIRNALWRLDSLAAPLLAIEINRPSLAVSFAGTPMLAPRLISGYVFRDAAGRWTIRRDGQSTARHPLEADSAFHGEDWDKRLGTAEPMQGVTPELATTDARDAALVRDLVIWPGPAPRGPPAQGSGQVAQNDAAGQDAQIRNQFVQQVQQAAQSNRPNSEAASSSGPLRPMWVGRELVLARQSPSSKSAGAADLEICWLNWTEWEALLAAQLARSSPPLRLQPLDAGVAVGDGGPLEKWRMVSLPIGLEPVSSPATGAWPAPFVAIWGLLLAVAFAFGWLMWQTLALSERRAAFVSAVTHELRTPLTTFRLYTEMLSDGVASDPGQQQAYFEILHREANRLTHLVENVLAYARLEHGRSTARNEAITAGDLIERCRPRLEQRVSETPLALSLQISDAARFARLTTNAMAVEQILFNLIDNACKYARDAADARILCTAEVDGGKVCLRVSDFGPGLSASARKTLFQAFQKSSSQAAESAPGVGLGLALSQRLARELGGSLSCRSNSPTGLIAELELPADPA
ncbi:MAG: HAMP domain-containing histidine kinase [Planctomycetia bacterium]|nr:HAMP domain-containing histidine kinase [Planctomycetia bacterium]